MLRSQLLELQQENAQLRQKLRDLELSLELVADHGTTVEAELQSVNQRLQLEIAERRQAEARLELLTTAITQRNLDLEILLETLREHGDAIHEQWHSKVQEATELAGIDSLTQIPNRRRFDEHLDAQWQQMARHQLPLSLIVADIDYFKQYNDTYGHLLGDTCLRHIAQSLNDTLSLSGDLVARFGGEEFVVILPERTLEEAIALAYQLQSCVRQLQIPHACSPIAHFVTLSMGVASQIPQADTSPKLLLDAADRALYAAKQSGRNQISCAQS